MLTFRAIARASRLEWNTIECTATGTLDRVERRHGELRDDAGRLLEALRADGVVSA